MESRTNELVDDDQESVRDMFLDRVGNDVVTESLQVQQKVHEQISLNRRFTEINGQISSLSFFV